MATMRLQSRERLPLLPGDVPYEQQCFFRPVPTHDVENVRESAQDQPGVAPERTRQWTLRRILILLVQTITAGGVLTLCIELPLFFLDAAPLSHAKNQLAIVTTTSYSATPPSQTTTSTTVLSTEVAKKIPVHPYIPPGARDCGVFTMKCAGAEGACNNACYAVNCLQPSWGIIRYIGQRYGDRSRVHENEDLHNRGHAGAKVLAYDGGRRAICGQLPFSQKLRDPQVRANGDPFDAQYDTDEWPMASTTQGDFKPGLVRNSLRCMPKAENQRAGGRWGAFVSDSGDNPGKTCDGPLKRADIARVEFDLEGADPAKVQYCLPTPDCRNDGYQFALTALIPDTYLGGRVDSQPRYDPRTNNRYTLMRTAADDEDAEPAGPAEIKQCMVIVTLRATYLNAEVFDADDQYQGSTGMFSRPPPTGTAPRVYVIHGLDYPVTITARAYYNGTEIVDHDLNFRYGPLGAPNSLRSFEWNINTVGFATGWIGGTHRYCHLAYNHRRGRGYWKCGFPC